MIGDSDDKINFPHELLLTNRQAANICKAFVNNLSTPINLSKTTGLLLRKNVIKLLAKSVLIHLGLAAAASAADAGKHKKSLMIWSSSFFLLCLASSSFIFCFA